MGDTRAKFSRMVVTVSLFALGAITILNLNGLFVMMFGRANVFSPLMLLLSSAIFVFVPRSYWRSLFPVLKFYFLFMFFYIAYGSLSIAMTGIGVERLLGLIRAPTGGLFVVTAAALGFAFYASEVNKSNPLRFVYILAIASLASIFYGRYDTSIYEFARFGEMHQSRFSGFFANPNQAGMAASASAVFCMYYLSIGSRATLQLVLLILSCVGAFLTFSRGSILTCAAIVSLYSASLFFLPNKRRLALSLVLVAGIASAFAISEIQKDENWNAIQSNRIASLEAIATTGEIPGEENIRIDLLKKGYAKISESPFLGHGLGAMQSMDGGLGVHNTFFTIQGEAGIVGTSLFALVLVAFLKKSLTIRDRFLQRFVWFYMFVFLSMLFFEHGGLASRNHNFFLGVSFALLYLSHRTGRSAVPQRIESDTRGLVHH